MALKKFFNLRREKPTPETPPASSSSHSQSTIGAHTVSKNEDVYDETTATTTPLNSITSDFSSASSSTVYNNYLNLTNHPKLSKELVPIITLLTCQNSRIYIEGQLYLNVEHNDPVHASSDLSYSVVDGVIKGNQFIIYRKGLESQFKPITFDLLEATVKLQSAEKSFIITNSVKAAYHIRFTELKPLQEWIAAIKLSIFEYHKVNEAYTASLLSAKGPTLSDLHVVLAENRFDHEEWCSIKFGKSGKWVNCYCVITPFEKGRKGHKNGSIQFYTTNRTSKKNLICSISSIDSCYAVYTHVDLIDESSLVRLNGDVAVYNVDGKFESVSRSNSTRNSPASTSRSRSNSILSNSTVGTSNLHKRASSISSSSSSLSKNTTKGLLLKDTSLYILPKAHNGVKNFETLIRYLIPIYDSFQLYGRPKRLNSEKSDPRSLLFGLPSLPHVEHLSDKHAYQLISDNWQTIVQLEEHEIDNDDSNTFNFGQLFIAQIISLYKDDPRHQGFGDIKTTLIRESNFENPLVTFNSYNISDFDSSNPSTPKTSFSSSDLPAAGAEILQKVVHSTSSSQLHKLSLSTSPPVTHQRNYSNGQGFNVPIVASNSAASSRLASPISRSGSFGNLNAYTNVYSNTTRSRRTSITPSVQAAQYAFKKEDITEGAAS